MMNILQRLRGFFTLPVIITVPLTQITDGQVGDAVPLMTILNGMAAQVNANAQPLTTTPTLIEWQPLGQTPTFVSGTQFTVPGNVTSTLMFGRVLQTQNTSGFVFSIITASVFGAVTTVTVTPLISGGTALDAGLSAVNYGILNATTPSSPAKSIVVVSGSHNTETLATTTALTISTANGFTVTPQNGSPWLGEFSAATGIFTATRAGYYQVNASVGLVTTGVTFNGVNIIQFASSGSVPLNLGGRDFTTGVAGTNRADANVCGVFLFTAGMTLSLQILCTFSAGQPVINSSLLSIVGPL